MSCTPLHVVPGPFSEVSWSGTAPGSVTIGDKTIQVFADTGNILVTQNTTGKFLLFGNTPNAELRYMVFGSANNVLILKHFNSIPYINRVSLCDFTMATPSKRLVTDGYSGSATFTLPIVHQSASTGTVFLIYRVRHTASGPRLEGIGITRSDNGIRICNANSFLGTVGDVTAEATATHLIVHTPGKTTSCELEIGESVVTTDLPLEFQDVVAEEEPITASSTKLFQIRNMGDSCLAVNDIVESFPFSVASTVPPLGEGLKPSEMMIVEVAFAPNAFGSYDENLAIVPTPPTGDLTLHCIGLARMPIVQIGFNPTSIHFGALLVDNSFSVRTLDIINEGEKILNVTVEAFSGDNFEWDALNEVIPPGESRSLDITFDPDSIGNFTKTLLVNSNAPGSPHPITLEGIGRPDIRIIPPSLNFMKVKVEQTKSETLTIVNDGQVEHSVTVPESPPGSSFHWDELCHVIPPQGSIELEVRFEPTVLGLLSETLVFESDAPGSPFSVNLSGEGAAPKIGFSITRINFGRVAVGDIRTRIGGLRIRSDGEVDLQVTVQAPPPTSFFFWSTFDGIIPPGEERQLYLEFRPKGAGSVEETLIVESDAPGSPHSITLRGRGIVGEPL